MSTNANIFLNAAHTRKNGKDKAMIFRKSERKRFPTILGLTMGALAVIGVVSIKNKSKEIASNAACKMKGLFKKNSNSECPMDMQD